MSDTVYDLPIGEVAKILDKSDRQVRRYVKEQRLAAKPMRVDGHIKLLFNRDEVLALKEHFGGETAVGDKDSEIFVDAQLMDEGDDVQSIDATLVDSGAGDSSGIKYAIDALREQIQDMRRENQDLHRQLEQTAGLVGFWQGKAEVLQEEMKALAPVPKPEDAEPGQKKRSFVDWFLGKN